MHDNITPPDYDEIDAEQDWKDEWMAEQVKNAMAELKETEFVVFDRGTKTAQEYNLKDIISESDDEDFSGICDVLGQVLFGHTVNQYKLWGIIERCLEGQFNADKAYDEFIADREEG